MLLTPSFLFALFLGWTSLLAVVALPLDNNATGSGDGSVAGVLGRAIGTRTHASGTSIKIPVDLSILWPGTQGEHWVLILNKNRNFHAKQVSWNKELPLEPSEFTKVYNNPIDLNCQATFESQAEMDMVFKELVDKIKMEKPPYEKGWNCMDYVELALKHLHDGKHISSIPGAFTNLYKTNYDKVREKVYGVSAG